MSSGRPSSELEPTLNSSLSQSSYFPTDSVVIFSEKDEFEKLAAVPAKNAKR